MSPDFSARHGFRMLEPVSQRTYEKIEALATHTTVAGSEIAYCPCRILPETVLSLKTVLRDIERLWQETLGADDLTRITATDEGGRFFAGEVRLTVIQEGRPEMVGVWVPIPPDYPRRLKVQLIDAIEPYPFP